MFITNISFHYEYFFEKCMQSIMLCPTDVTQSQYAVSTVYKDLTPILVGAYLATNSSN